MEPTKLKMTAEERYAFDEISYHIGDGKPHLLEDIKGAAVPKDKIPEYMVVFIKKGRYTFDGKHYTITGIGKAEFKKKRDSHERAAPRRLVY